MKIVILEAFALNEYDLDWRELYKITDDVTSYSRTSYEQIPERIKDADIVICNKCNIDENSLCTAAKLKIILITATGTDGQDLAACRAHNVAVANVPSYSTHSVAQLTFALLLQICQTTSAHEKAMREGYWQVNVPAEYNILRQTELSQKSFGVIGFGSIGKQVAKIANAFGMKVFVYSRSTPKEKYDDIDFVNLDTLLSKSDVVSLHCPLTEDTRFLICKENIEKMKDGAILINTARGGLVNEKDLSNAIKSDKIAAYGADVMSEEPVKKDNVLLTTPHVFLTPHIAWATQEALARLAAAVIKNLQAFLSGKPENIVN